MFFSVCLWALWCVLFSFACCVCVRPVLTSESPRVTIFSGRCSCCALVLICVFSFLRHPLLLWGALFCGGSFALVFVRSFVRSLC
uniref:Secreted protein n=1 Tax=Anopheles darlingi TaxID=43151 RepID=A0A2M4DCS0_ANODA